MILDKLVCSTAATVRTLHSKDRNAFRDIRRHQIRIALDGLRTREVFPAGDGLIGSSRRYGLRSLRGELARIASANGNGSSRAGGYIARTDRRRYALGRRSRSRNQAA